jgi:adenine deaminase
MTRRAAAMWIAVVTALAVVPVGAIAAVKTINQAAPRGVDLIRFNGEISMMDTDGNVVQAIAIDDDEIVAVGNNGFVNRLGGSNTTRVNLQGRRVLTGLIDGHLHGMRTRTTASLTLQGGRVVYAEGEFAGLAWGDHQWRTS